MKTLLNILIVLLLTTLAFAEPFLSCDPQTGVDKYLIDISKIDGVDQTGSHQYQVDAEPDGSLHYDLANWPRGHLEGSYNAGWEITLDGVPQGVYVWSDPPVPFDLIYPPGGQPPSGTSITQK